MEDKEILDIKVGETTVREMPAMSFLQWISKKINGVPLYSAAAQELILAVSAPPMGSQLVDSEKVRLIRKMLALNISL